VRVVRNGLQPQARQYIDYLTSHGRGLPAELIMGLRIESLPLKCMHSHQRSNETIVQQQQREVCPVCKQSAETPAHFLLDCPVYNAARTTLFNILHTTHPNKMSAVAHMPSTQVWRALLADDIIKPAAAANAVAVGHENAPLEAASAAAAIMGEGHGAVAGAGPAVGVVGDVHAGRFTALHALADYVMTAWKLRSTALAGRETNGGNPMV
jgi:hypothetical protein